MNMLIKDHHLTRKISGISGNKNGSVLITFEPTHDFCNEHILFLKDELDCKTKEILLIGSIRHISDPSNDLPGDSPVPSSNILSKDT